MFLSNWLVFKIVLAAVTGLVDYPLAVDVLLVYDNANKLYLSGGSLEYVSNVVLYKGEASYEISESSQLVTNYYITQPGTYRADLQICGIDYKTNEVEVTGSVTPEKTWGNEQKLLGETASDYFGYSVSISGDYAIVGAPYEDTGGSNAGAAYIYTRNPSTGGWGSEQKIHGEAAGDEFGKSVSISGDYAIVGAPYEDTGASSAGAAYIYTRSGTTWGNEQKLLGEVASDFFGWSVAIDGGNAIVGAQYEDTGASNAGAAYIYELTPVAGLTFDGYNQLSLTNTPTYRSSKLAYGSNVYDVGTLTCNLFIEKTGEYASLTFDTSSNVAYFSNVTVGTIIIAPPSPSLTFDTYNKLSIENITPTSTTLRLDSNTYDIGTATDIYIEDSGTYDAAITASDKFALVSNVVGTVTQVAVYDYTQAGTTEQKIQASDKQANDNFGYSVSISGDYAIVGALGEDTGATDEGAAYIYTRDASTGVWGSEQKIQASDKQTQDYFGWSVSISGDYAIVGARYEDTGGTNAGAAYIYT